MSKLRPKSGPLAVAKLLTVTLTTRVIVPAGTDQFTAYDKAHRKLLEKLGNEGIENISRYVDDKECPYGTFEEDK